MFSRPPFFILLREKGVGVRKVFLPFSGAVRPWICSKETGAIVLLPDERQVSQFISDGKAILPDVDFVSLPEIPLEKRSIEDISYPSSRGYIFSRWREEGGVMVSTPGGLVAPLTEPGEAIQLKVGDRFGRDRFISWLEEQRFSRSDLVWKAGDYAVRGGVVDCFDPSSKMAVRVSFFDDEVDDMRLFSTGDQRTRYSADEWTFRSVWSGEGGPKLPLYPSRLIVFDPPRCRSCFDGFRWLWNEISSIDLPEDRWDRWLESASSLVFFETLKGPGQEELNISEPPRFRGNLSIFKEQLSLWEKKGFEVLARSATGPPSEVEEVRWDNRPVSSGFIDWDKKVVLLSDVELFGLHSAAVSEEEVIPSELNLFLEEGAWMVHKDHGLCRYSGTEVVETKLGSQELLVLSFQRSQRLMLPVTSMDKVSIYGGEISDDLSPDVLGSSRWKNALIKAEKRIEEEASELLEIYAKRRLSSGKAFPVDDEMMAQFESMFPHVETKDQKAAIEDVKRDMESSFPMDRLIVGDVGYGKTEVALRATFKAVIGGAQVLVVVPTTVLAQQHYRLFLGRMAPFGVNVEQLSRFLSPRKQEEVVKRLSEGKVDVVIGTHRLLQKDISVPKLGLVVVDEEHRFGTAHKERLKKIRSSVDFLALSATPIPRSLSMSLRGLRDISTIETAPINRPPVITVTGAWEDSLVQKAIARELNRGGQVYLLHNRVESIGERAGWIKARFPDFNVEIAHGQMDGKLEDVMMAFYEGQVDILVCTTIIESGLDVGRANTLIVDDSRSLGLAQMHQLRGRIGRREERGYVFFLYPSNLPLPYRTGERLDAIGRLSYQGAGYDIARQDLLIRGAGDMLGFSQHGHRDRIGTDLYYKKLRDKIESLKGRVRTEVSMDIRIPLMIPSGYIPQNTVRMAMYRRMFSVQSVQDALNLKAEMTDRFGPPPDEALCLIYLALLKTEGANQGIIHVMIDEKKTFCRLKGKEKEWIGPGGTEGIVLLFRRIKEWCDG